MDQQEIEAAFDTVLMEQAAAAAAKVKEAKSLVAL